MMVSMTQVVVGQAVAARQQQRLVAAMVEMVAGAFNGSGSVAAFDGSN
jgi:hypothetical protein